MHRSTTTAAAALLLSVAVPAAVSGCVSVERPGGSSGIPAATAPPSTPSPAPPRTEGRSRDRAEESPAREVLERMGPPRPRSPRRPAPAALPSAPPRHPDRPAPPPVRRPPAARPDAGATRAAPAPSAPAVPRTDVCALGETYGGWDPGSPQAVICREAYRP
ncbi:hypothetical protein AB0I16_20610 [Streptomyces sp. NPDC050703]|uniref:hypothetical protein n=1 Tax=Streptomyces sp. NPDC050703 TaxID=3157218 RepID=UPI003446399B